MWPHGLEDGKAVTLLKANKLFPAAIAPNERVESRHEPVAKPTCQKNHGLTRSDKEMGEQSTRIKLKKRC